MIYPGHQPQFGYPQQPPVTSPAPPKPVPTRGRKPRPWHIAAAVALGLLLISVVLAALPPKCVAAPPAPKPVQSESACIAEYKREHPLGSDIDAKMSCRLQKVGDDLAVLGSGSQVCTPRAAGAVGITGWGGIAAAVVTLVLGLRRRREFAEHRKNVHVVEDFIRRVPEGYEDRVPPQILSDVAQRGQVAASTTFMDREYLGALSGDAAVAKSDLYNAAANRAAIAYNAMLPVMEGAQMPEDEEPLEAPDLGGADPVTAPAADTDDDWLSGVDGDDSGADW